MSYHRSKVQIRSPNQCLVVAIPQQISSEKRLRSQNLFGKFGNILKINFFKLGKKCIPCACIIYTNTKAATDAIQWINNIIFDFNGMYWKSKARYGTTKYCSSFIKNERCFRKQCPFVHWVCNVKDMITFDEIQKFNQKITGEIKDKFYIALFDEIAINESKPSNIQQRNESKWKKKQTFGIVNRNVDEQKFKSKSKPKPTPNPFTDPKNDSRFKNTLQECEQIKKSSINTQKITLISNNNKPLLTKIKKPQSRNKTLLIKTKAPKTE
eukprot:483488_1